MPDATRPATNGITNAETLEPDGNDDADDAGMGTVPDTAHFERVGHAPLSLRRICDLKPLGESLYAAHAVTPLGSDGATISRYSREDGFGVAFDWNRTGEPAKGGGAGQGFLRIRVIDHRLYVPDSDPPYNGLGLAENGTEGYVFLSTREGTFARARAPHARPPGLPDKDTKPGAAVLPRAYHVLDVIRFQNKLYASTGSVPPNERAWHGPSPGALHVANDTGTTWSYALGYPSDPKDGVYRLTFMVRFQGKLFAGIQEYSRRDRHSYLVFSAPRDNRTLRAEDANAITIDDEHVETLRWFVDRGTLYWIGESSLGVHLRASEDGTRWKRVPLPPALGAPLDITRFRDSLVVLTERALLRLHNDGTTTPIATIQEKKSPFVRDDFFCAAPIAVFNNELYAGGQRDGSLYKLVAESR